MIRLGFSDTEEKRLTYFIHYENEDDAGDAMFIGGPVAFAWKHFDDQTRKSARQEPNKMEHFTPLKNHPKG